MRSYILGVVVATRRVNPLLLIFVSVNSLYQAGINKFHLKRSHVACIFSVQMDGKEVMEFFISSAVTLVGALEEWGHRTPLFCQSVSYRVKCG